MQEMRVSLSLQRTELLCNHNFLAGAWRPAAQGAVYAVEDPGR